jgi:hypothetical protein
MAENFTVSHFIDPITLRKAAEQLLVIDEAGYTGQLEQDFHARVSERDIRDQENYLRYVLKSPINAVDTFAQRLATLTDCPLYQARGVAIDVLGYSLRREAGLDLLARMSADVRKLQAQATRSQFTPRRAS